MDLMISTYDTHLKDKDDNTTDDGKHRQNESATRNTRSNYDAAFIAGYRKQLASMMEEVRDQREKLAREVERWCKERGV